MPERGPDDSEADDYIYAYAESSLGWGGMIVGRTASESRCPKLWR